MHNTDKDKINSRRSFIKKATAASAAIAGTGIFPVNLRGSANDAGQQPIQAPWFRRITRWGQTNITEKDPSTYDITWWRNHWKKTQTQGVIINAGGIVAYYPTKIPYHYRARYLQGRDLFGELCRAAHEDGLAVFARMDSNRANEELYKAHPDWFAVDAKGEPYRAADLYITCINGPYYQEHIPSILTEITNMYHPEGFTDNSWAGLGRDSICYCNNCKKSFKAKTGKGIPGTKNWDDPVYRQWIRWNYERRIEIWELNNRTTKAAGGPDCIWSGMNSGSISGQARSFRDYKAIAERADIIMMDHQARSDSSGFQQVTDVGKMVHGILGWDKLIPDSMAMYQAGRPTFRVSSKPANEAHMWMIEAFAGGIQPWWHHISAYHEDRRMYHTAEPVYRWYTANEEYLINRTPVATVGILWSQENTDYFGRDDAEALIEVPWRGITQALVRARIPYIPVHADHIDREASQLKLLILPNFGSISQSQLASLKRFVDRGGNLFATQHSSLYDETGAPLNDYALNDLFGAHSTVKPVRPESRSINRTLHTYLRLSPEIRSRVYGPQTGTEPAISEERHEVLKGFELTDILPFGGGLTPIRTESSSRVIMTFIPEFPIYPPETAWMREPKTDIPGLILKTMPNGSRIAFMPADIDSQFALYNLPDHGDLLKNIIRWASKDDIPLSVEGAGLIDCNLYQQKGRMILHLTNLTSSATCRAPVDEYIPVGPVRVKVKLNKNVKGEYLNLLVAGQRIPAVAENGWSFFTISSILNHEIAVIS
ncbi:MAG TPA: beta-galactosidase [Bacteroidales bacterium]|nr:beta-galactosidase [Bacteroidales bacterium]